MAKYKKEELKKFINEIFYPWRRRNLQILQQRSNAVTNSFQKSEYTKIYKSLIQDFLKLLDLSKTFGTNLYSQEIKTDSLLTIIEKEWNNLFAHSNNPQKKAMFQTVTSLLGKIFLLERSGVIIRITKNNGNLEIFPDFRFIFPFYLRLKMSGNTVKDITTLENLRSCLDSAVESHVGDEIEIFDDGGSPLSHFIIEIPRLTPVFIKYTHKKLGKLLFISIPESVDPTTFSRFYGKAFLKKHRDFYKKTFIGRPKTKELTIIEIQSILKKYEGKHYSLGKLYTFIGRELGKSPLTIQRAYKAIVKEGMPKEKIISTQCDK